MSKDGNVEDKRAGLAPGVAQSDIARSNGLSYLHVHEPRKRIGGVYYCDRPTAMPMNTRNHELAGKSTIAWRRHELLSKAIFEALLKQSDAQNLDIKHNVTVKGTKTAHQIDVLWKFRMGGLDHYVIVQVKKQKWRAKKGDLLLFQSVLLDIAGQPKGVFVSERGYQKGALEVARATGITAFEIREVDGNAPRARVTMTNISIGILTQRPDQVAMEITILEPTITDVRMTMDGSWLAKHPEAWSPSEKVNVMVMTTARFLDAAGEERTSIRKLVQDRIRDFGQAGNTQLEVEFPDPTYMSGIDVIDEHRKPIKDLKIVRLAAALEIVKKTEIWPLFSSAAATYLFKNTIEGDQRYLLVAGHEAELVAELSIPLLQFQVRPTTAGRP